MWLWSLWWFYYIRNNVIIEIIRICRLNNNFLCIFKSPSLLHAYTLWTFELVFIVGAWRVVGPRFNCYLVAFIFIEILHKMHHLIMQLPLLHKVTLSLLHLLLYIYILFLTDFPFILMLWRCLRWYIRWWLIKYFYCLILFVHAGLSSFTSCPRCLIWLLLPLLCRCESLRDRIEDRHSVADVSPRSLIFLIYNFHWESLKLNS
jgi:hypothetical protein